MATDPLDALHRPVIPVRPRPAFTTGLRRRLADALGVEPSIPRPGGTSTSSDTSVAFVPERLRSITPYLSVDDPRRAIAFYKAVFGAVEESPPLVDDQGRVGHAELRIGDSVIMLAGELPAEEVMSPTATGATTVQLVLYVEDAEAVFDRAVAAGSRVWRSVSEQPHGARAGKVQDPFGHNWTVATQGETVVAEDHERRFAESGHRPVDTSALPAADHLGELFYFTLGVPDPYRARSFFSALLSWQLEPGHQPGAFHIANIATPGGLHGAETLQQTLCFRVPDIQAAVAQVRELGGEAGEPVLYDSGWDAPCRDDQGLEFHLSEPAAGY